MFVTNDTLCFFFFFFFFLSYFKFCSPLRPKAEVLGTQIARIRQGYGRNDPPPSPTHRQDGGNRGANPWSKTRTKRWGAQDSNQKYIQRTPKRKETSTRNTKKHPNSKRNQKYHNMEESTPEKAHPLTRAFNYP